MTSDSSPSPKQLNILKYIQSEIERTQRPPTLRAIAKRFQYQSVKTVQDHMNALIKKGLIKKTAGVARGIQIKGSIFKDPRIEGIAGIEEAAGVKRSGAQYLEKITARPEVPILGFVPAGSPIESIEASLGFLPVPYTKGLDGLFALKVKGESMRDAGILDGDYVIVRKQPLAHSGEIIVAVINGEATVKYLEKKQGRIRLLPANPHFKPIEFRSEMEVTIAGKVISVQRYYQRI